MLKSAELIERRERVVCPGVGRLSTLTAERATGATLTDLDGKEYIDFAGGIGVMNVGHGDPRVVEAIRQQAGKLLHTCVHVATYEPYVALCEKLVEILPHGDSTKAMLVNTGAEAVENAIKIARQATGRSGIICFTGAFHGRTLMCATLTSKVSYKANCGPFMPDVYRLPYPKPDAGEQINEQQLVDRELSRLRSALKDTVAPDSLAAIIIEVVQGEGGFHVAPQAYLEGLRTICDEHGIVLIFDEVQGGFARTGAWASYDHFGVIPDLSPWAKSMGGGMPISCVIGKASVMDRVTPGTLGGTYGGNPVACAAAIATIESMERFDLNGRARSIGAAIRERFEQIASQTVEVTDVRGLGAMMAIEFGEGGDPTRPAGAMVKAIVNSCLQRGLILLPAGVYGNVIRVLCPIVISDSQLSNGLAILEEEIAAHAFSGSGSPIGESVRKV